MLSENPKAMRRAPVVDLDLFASQILTLKRNLRLSRSTELIDYAVCEKWHDIPELRGLEPINSVPKSNMVNKINHAPRRPQKPFSRAALSTN
jgi:hypothetical protein